MNKRFRKCMDIRTTIYRILFLVFVYISEFLCIFYCIKNYYIDHNVTAKLCASRLNMSMTSELQKNPLNTPQIQKIIQAAKERAEDHYLEFAGTVLPHEAWALFQSDHALIVDVRTSEERKFVGLVEHTVHIPWAIGTALERNPHFAEELAALIEPNKIILLLCRSGKRSAAAANVALNSGLAHIYNIDQGFEGDLNETQQRGTFNGWRFHRLPWIQE